MSLETLTQILHQPADAVEHRVECGGQMVEIAGAGSLDTARQVARDNGIGRARDRIEAAQEACAQQEAATDAQHQHNAERGGQNCKKRFLQLIDLFEILADAEPQSAVKLTHKKAHALDLSARCPARVLRSGDLVPAQSVEHKREVPGKAPSCRIGQKIIEVEIGRGPRSLLDDSDEAVEPTRAKLKFQKGHFCLDAAH
jgi:hypothetical protein